MSEDFYLNEESKGYSDFRSFDRMTDRTQKFFNENEANNTSQIFNLSHYIDASTLSMSYSSVASNYSGEQSTIENHNFRKRVPFGKYDVNVKSCNQSYASLDHNFLDEVRPIPNRNLKPNFSEIEKPQCASSNANLRYIEDLLQEKEDMRGFSHSTDNSNNQSGFALGRFFPSS